MRFTSILFALALAAPGVSFAQDQSHWNERVAPFRVIGNVYYVGTAGIAAYLIADPKGLILIDGALPESGPIILANIRTLGFDPKAVRILVNTHAHWDHAGGLSAIKAATGARLLANPADRPVLKRGVNPAREDVGGFPPVKVDGELHDGETLKVGKARLTARFTPGHTKGCTSWTTRTQEGARVLDVLFACSITVAGQKLSGDPAYPNAAEDFRRSFAKLRALKADVFLSFHTESFDLAGKRARLEAGDRFAFVDPRELAAQVDRAEAAFDREATRQAR